MKNKQEFEWIELVKNGKHLSLILTDHIKNHLVDIDGTVCDDIANEGHRAVTGEWLKKNGFNYHGLLMGKPRGGNYHWIDNHIVRATRFDGKFKDLVEKNVSIQVFEQ